MSQTPLQTKRPIVVILGMHRSGTSLLGNFINAVGIDLGQDLLPADEWNAAGYWECRTIHGIHEQILKELNCQWHNPPLSFPANWWREPGILKLKSGLVEFVRSEYGKKDKIWGFKDPRTAILLPLWKEIFDELQLEPLYLLAVRHPESVAASLDTRDHLAFSHSQALWLKTNLDVLSHTRNNLRAIVDYDRWFDSGLEQARRVVAALDLSQSINETLLEEAVKQVIRPGLRHHSGKENGIYSPIVAEFYSLLCRATADGKIPDEISEVTATFEKSEQLLSIWDDLVRERDGIIAKRDTAIAKRDTAIAELGAIVAQREAILAQREATIAERREAIQEIDKKFARYRTRFRKQRKLLVIALIIVSLICLMLIGGPHWLK